MGNNTGKFSVYEEIVPIDVRFDRVAPYPYKEDTTLVFDVDGSTEMVRVPSAFVNVEDQTVRGAVVGERDDGQILINFPATSMGHNSLVIAPENLLEVAV